MAANKRKIRRRKEREFRRRLQRAYDSEFMTVEVHDKVLVNLMDAGTAKLVSRLASELGKDARLVEAESGRWITER